MALQVKALAVLLDIEHLVSKAQARALFGIRRTDNCRLNCSRAAFPGHTIYSKTRSFPCMERLYGPC